MDRLEIYRFGERRPPRCRKNPGLLFQNPDIWMEHYQFMSVVRYHRLNILYSWAYDIEQLTWIGNAPFRYRDSGIIILDFFGIAEVCALRVLSSLLLIEREQRYWRYFWYRNNLRKLTTNHTLFSLWEAFNHAIDKRLHKSAVMYNLSSAKIRWLSGAQERKYGIRHEHYQFELLIHLARHFHTSHFAFVQLLSPAAQREREREREREI